THLFQALKLGNIGKMPQWLTEGMAVYFGDGSRLDPKKKKIITSLIPRDRLLGLQDKIARGTARDLRSLVQIPYGRLTGSEYADAWSLCYFLFDGPKVEEGRKFIEKYWLGAVERQLTYSDFTTLADHYFGGMDAMEKEWVAYTKSLMPEPVGKVRGSELESFEYKFDWELPSDQWEWVTGKLENDALVGMQVPGTRVQCRLLMRNRDWKTPADKSVDDWLGYWEKAQGFLDVKSEASELLGLPIRLAFWSYPDPEQKRDEAEKDAAKKEKEEPGQGEKPDKKGEKKPEKPVAKIRVVAYVFPGFNRDYWIICESPEAEFDALRPYFDEVAKNLKIDPENRW
ncbi:MAG: hypothetical protein KDC38_21445, partial [Planctomycetes bacterium]|nr:hypothetical protein [Planctomycetota bacterium]